MEKKKKEILINVMLTPSFQGILLFVFCTGVAAPFELFVCLSLSDCFSLSPCSFP